MLVPLWSDDEVVITDDGLVQSFRLYGRDERCPFLLEKLREILIDVDVCVFEVRSGLGEDEISVLESQ